jgi:hypothetical protein
MGAVRDFFKDVSLDELLRRKDLVKADIRRAMSLVSAKTNLLEQIQEAIRHHTLDEIDHDITPCKDCEHARTKTCTDLRRMREMKTPKAMMDLIARHNKLVLIDCRTDYAAGKPTILRVKLNEPTPDCFERSRENRHEGIHALIEDPPDYILRHRFDEDAVIIPHTGETSRSPRYQAELAKLRKVSL